MTAGVLGMMTMQNEFSTARMREVWSDHQRLDKMCQVERTLAQVQGQLGIIPKSVADEINQKVQVDQIDIRQLYLASARAGHFTSGFVKYLSSQLSPEASEYIHYGATTQDILDTSAILQLREAHNLIVEMLTRIIERLLEQAQTFRQTIMVGRAHGQHSAPTTLGYKLAIIIDELDRSLQRLESVAKFVFSGSISGVVSTYASYGPLAIDVERGVCHALNLSVPRVPWHTQRDRFIEYAHILTLISGTLGKFGQDLYDMSRSELGEFEEMYHAGRQGSTTIPTLRPPYICEAIVNLSGLISQSMGLMYQSSRLTHEKDTIGWRNQWVALPEICLYLSAQLNYTQALLKAGRYNIDRIESNLYLKDGELLSEHVMFCLGRLIGKESAHQVLYQVMNNAKAQGISFAKSLHLNDTMKEYFTEKEINYMLDPNLYIGQAIHKTDLVINEVRERLEKKSGRHKND